MLTVFFLSVFLVSNSSWHAAKTTRKCRRPPSRRPAWFPKTCTTITCTARVKTVRSPAVGTTYRINRRRRVPTPTTTSARTVTTITRSTTTWWCWTRTIWKTWTVCTTWTRCGLISRTTRNSKCRERLII